MTVNDISLIYYGLSCESTSLFPATTTSAPYHSNFESCASQCYNFLIWKTHIEDPIILWLNNSQVLIFASLYLSVVNYTCLCF